MAKRLTDEHRTARHQERLDHARAWRARMKERRTKEERATAETEARFKPALYTLRSEEEALDKDWYRVLENRDRAIAQIEAEVKAKKEQMSELKNANRAKTSEVWSRRTAEIKAIEARLDEEYPDLKGSARWSAACWVPPLKG